MLEKLPSGAGEALQQHRAGFAQTALQRLNGRASLAFIRVTSHAFEDGQAMPARFTADGEGISPPLEWHGVPEGASSIAILVEDADSPTPHPLVHAIVADLSIQDHHLAEGALDSPHHVGIGLDEGRNSYLTKSWLPPDPPPGHGPHRYVFQVFALRGPPLGEAPGRGKLYEALEAQAVAAGELIGIYERL